MAAVALQAARQLYQAIGRGGNPLHPALILNGWKGKALPWGSVQRGGLGLSGFGLSRFGLSRFGLGRFHRRHQGTPQGEGTGLVEQHHPQLGGGFDRIAAAEQQAGAGGGTASHADRRRGG